MIIYSDQDNNSPIEQQEINDKADIRDKFGGNEINITINLISKVVSKVKYMISTIIDPNDVLQNTIGNANIKRIDTAAIGCWNVFLNIGAMTEHLHTENTCGYTVIKIPEQKLKWT